VHVNDEEMKRKPGVGKVLYL